MKNALAQALAKKQTDSKNESGGAPSLKYTDKPNIQPPQLESDEDFSSLSSLKGLKPIPKVDQSTEIAEPRPVPSTQKVVQNQPIPKIQEKPVQNLNPKEVPEEVLKNVLKLE